MLMNFLSLIMHRVLCIKVIFTGDADGSVAGHEGSVRVARRHAAVDAFVRTGPARPLMQHLK